MQVLGTRVGCDSQVDSQHILKLSENKAIYIYALLKGARCPESYVTLAIFRSDAFPMKSLLKSRHLHHRFIAYCRTKSTRAIWETCDTIFSPFILDQSGDSNNGLYCHTYCRIFPMNSLQMQSSPT